VQKIIIKNFGPIKDAEIEIKKTLILIGEQASGKSTIAKLIYFFRTLPEELKIHLLEKFVYPFVYERKKIETKYDFDDIIIKTIKQKFNDCFSHIHNFSNFKIKYFYQRPDQSDAFIVLEMSSNQDFNVKFDEDTRKCFEEELYQAMQNIQPMPEPQFHKILKRNLSGLWHLGGSNLFIVDSRMLTTKYSRKFRRKLSVEIDEPDSYDEKLMLKFLERVEKIFDRFERNSSSFEKLSINVPRRFRNEPHKLTTIVRKINSILKGDYVFENGNEKIKLNGLEGIYTLLRDASTGQQDVIRILQDIFLTLKSGDDNFRVIEEPDAHVFPEAQKLLVEIFACFVNYYDNNQLIITTHSPYTLTAYNNLLFANRVIQKNPDLKEEVYKHIDKECILDSKDFSAYALKIVQNEDDKYCQKIVDYIKGEDTETGLINQNFLDSVSDTLNAEFQALYSLHTKTFARK